MRSLKALGLALVAALAMSAVAATGASAQFESEAADTVLDVTSNETQKFTYSSGGIAVECNEVTVESTVAGTATTEVTAIPHYTDCEPILGNATAIDFNSCAYVFTLADNATTGTAHIECDSGDSVTVTVGASGSLCSFHIGAQTVGNITYSVVGSGSSREIKLHPTVTGIDATRTGSALCGAASSSTGTYVGDLTVRGTSGGNQVGIFVD